ncbi:MAG: 6-carboxytetrahydropterin synthase [Candidatus Brocadiae bacterium]|nr:6-carboxytetrahydropterin synthase [Candidatus Brocadiia bacterium]
MRITREFTFEAAHHLTRLPGGPEPNHGHTWKLAVTLEGPVRPDGMVYDFVRLGEIVRRRILKLVDHRDLNRVLPNPSAERVALWCWSKLKDLPLAEITVHECQGCFATYRGEPEPEAR